MVSKYHRLLQQGLREEEEGVTERNMVAGGEQRHGHVDDDNAEGDADFYDQKDERRAKMWNPKHESANVSAGGKQNRSVRDCLPGSLPPVANTSTDAAVRFDRERKNAGHGVDISCVEGDGAQMGTYVSTGRSDAKAGGGSSAIGVTADDESDGNLDTDGSDASEGDEVESTTDADVYGEDDTTEGPRGGVRLYSCDACPHAVFTTHAALLAHAEEHHADLLPDHARLRRIAQKLNPVWNRALNARRNTITSWGKKIFHVAAQRDAGESKMQEAHRARAQLECVVRRWHDKARVFIFGSSVAMGVWDGTADIDFAVVDVDAMERGSWPPLEKNAVRSITELLRRVGFSFVNLEPISHARVPIIKHHASSPILTVARRDAEDVVARSIRFILNGPATGEDRLLLEGSVRDAVGPTGVQQVWWNRTSDMMSATLESTTAAVRAAMCSPALASASLRTKVQPAHDECRPELYNIDFDLSFRAFGIRNSTLLRKYLLSHPCARPGAIVLKDWSKTSGVNNSVNGYFTSYAINIMWIYYLVQKGYVPYVDPLEIPESLVNYTDFDPRYTPMIDPEITNTEREELYKAAGDMLVGFFYFYSFEFDWGHNVISLNRPGITTKRMLGWHVEDVVPVASTSVSSGGGGSNVKRHPTRYELCIEDPYEENLNLGRHIGVTKSLRVRTELYRGLLSLLKEGETRSCVFAAADSSGTPAAGGKQSAALPARALFKLMALTTQAISESRRLPQSNSDNSGRIANGDNESLTEVGGGHRVEGAGVDPASCAGASLSSFGEPPIGVHEKTLESIFVEKAPMEFQLVRKVWNWHQLIHRLGYKIHRGHVMPRREVGVRCTARRDAEETTTELASDVDTTKSLRPGRGLTDTMLRDLSRGYMTLTPEWVAWSAPWVSQHLRGYSRLTTVRSAVADETPPALATVPSVVKPPTGEAVMGAMRTTRRNAAPARRVELLKLWLWRGISKVTPFKSPR
ncbi:KRET1 [Trypanosoma brucei gambiense DAL972]|uniref:RNA uridylyltransferase n=1 Tax=Trypanosoma brucei gambiense (strain MHOM/CI/86/DAL972) TaxID=679716 RepID=C9ZSY2_TRYB9|nr:KRET1 [Trypanosoma brucei gambiense DAL972]CBH12517.1 KRET1 [Trypanosoma brucei gambiense DAL972]|eukprot:XP_011774797.1 KRET1 [Trypanosoma brucei gambiense DAL972]